MKTILQITLAILISTTVFTSQATASDHPKISKQEFTQGLNEITKSINVKDQKQKEVISRLNREKKWTPPEKAIITIFFTMTINYDIDVLMGITPTIHEKTIDRYYQGLVKSLNMLP